MKLISMTDFVLRETNSPTTLAESFQRCVTYANFLRQPLKLEMFVPCIDGVPFNYSLHGNKEDFEKAKEKVLFEGFEFNGKYVKYSEDWLYLDEEICEAETIEFLITYNINLTPNAIKEIGLTI